MEFLIELIMRIFSSNNKEDLLKAKEKYKNIINGNTFYNKPLPIYANPNLNNTINTAESINLSDSSDKSIYDSFNNSIYNELNNISASAVEPKKEKIQDTNSVLNLNFNNKNAAEGLIYSEILGKPLSKRKRRATSFGHKRFNR